MTKKACIFDLDGTLLNTIQDLGVSCNVALKEAGMESIPLEQYPFLVGDGMKKLITRASSLPPNTPEFDRVFQAFLQHYRKHSTDFTTIYHGVLELLNELSKRGILLGILSNKGDSFVKDLVEHFFGEDFFVLVRGQVDSFPTKPDPSSLLDMLKLLEVDRKEALYIGDSNVDVQTAKNASVFCVGAVWGFRGEKELKMAGADALAYQPMDVLRWAERG